jgi:uncharacterized sulfatase
VETLKAGLKAADSGERYWAALGLLMQKRHQELQGALNDPAPSVRIVAAEAIGRFGAEQDLQKALDVLIGLSAADTNGAYVSMQALNAIQSLGAKAESLKPKLRTLQTKDPNAPARPNDYAFRMVRTLLNEK